MIETITSIKDEKIILARTIKSSKGRVLHQRILLEGEEIINWAIANSLVIENIIISNKTSQETIKKYESLNYKILIVSEGILKKITDTNYIIPIVAIAKMPLKNSDCNPIFTVVLDSVQDFGNIGTIIRTCNAFGISKLFCTKKDIDIYNRKTIEASRGSVFVTQLVCFQNEIETIQYLKNQDYQIVVTSPRGIELQSLIELKPSPVALIIGNETTGVHSEFEKHADYLIQIPMFHTVESLNVGVATGISIYELKLKQVLTMIEERIKATLGRELNVAGMLVQKALDTELKKVSELSSQQVIFMMVLKCDQKMKFNDMCKQFGILESESKYFLEPLLNAGLVIMENELTLTNKGEEILAKLWTIIESTEGKILSNLSVKEISTFMTNLHQVQERCTQIMQGN